MRKVCFWWYRAAAQASGVLLRWGLWGPSDWVYRLVPLRVVRVGYEVWTVEQAADFEAHLRWKSDCRAFALR